MIRKYVFGPVASRRLGVSLGVDLVRPKTCSLDCIYCEAKATTELTLDGKQISFKAPFRRLTMTEPRRIMLTILIMAPGRLRA